MGTARAVVLVDMLNPARPAWTLGRWIQLLALIAFLVAACTSSHGAISSSQADAAQHLLGGEPDLILILRPRALLDDEEFSALLRCSRAERKRLKDGEVRLLRQIEEIFVAARHDSRWHTAAWIRGGQDFGGALSETARDSHWHVENEGDQITFRRGGEQFLVRKTTNGWIAVTPDLQDRQADLEGKIESSGSTDALALIQVRGPIVTIAGALAELKYAPLRGIASHLRSLSVELHAHAVAELVIEFDDASAVERLVALRDQTKELREGTEVLVRGSSVVVRARKDAVRNLCR